MTEKILVLIRHAKSSWAHPELSDFERPLNKRGKRDAPFMGRQLKKRGLMPDLFLASPAKRAKLTAKAIATELGLDQQSVVFDENIYHAGQNEMVHIIQQTDASHDVLFLVGHNFTITDVASLLAAQNFENVPTTGMVGIAFTSTWDNVGKEKGKLLFFDYPKLHKETQ